MAPETITIIPEKGIINFFPVNREFYMKAFTVLHCIPYQEFPVSGIFGNF
jgi:hypothetical protein